MLRAGERAEKKVVIGDGAESIWNIADDRFPEAIQIVALFHARRHLWDVARKLTRTKRRNSDAG
jgi:transposase